MDNKRILVMDLVDDEEGEIIEDIKDNSSKDKNVVNNVPAISIKFRDLETAFQYKLRILNFFDSFLHRKSDEINLQTLDEHFYDHSLENDSDDSVKCIQSFDNTNLPILIEKEPVKQTKSLNLSYDLKHREENSTPLVEKKSNTFLKNKKEPQTICYNCGENHSFRQCQLPLNCQRIEFEIFKREIMSEIASSPNSKKFNKRYHNNSAKNEERFPKLKPGKISKTLMQALGITSKDVPLHIYKMRVHGYPPGWLLELQKSHRKRNKLNVFGCDLSHMSFDYDNNTNEVNSADNSSSEDDDIDKNNIISYKGFNEALDHGIRDFHLKFKCPAMSKNQSRKALAEELNTEIRLTKLKKSTFHRNKRLKMEDDRHNLLKLENNEDLEQQSQTIVELTKRKQQILNELNSTTLSTSLQLPNNQTNEIIITDDSESETESSTAKNLANFSFGTPILNYVSKYNTVPSMDHFSKGITPMLFAENLPNTTGHYQRLSKVIGKLRSRSTV